MNGININHLDGQTTAALSLHAAVRDVAGAVLHFQPPSGLAIAPQERTHALPCAHGPDTLPGTGRTLYFQHQQKPKRRNEMKKLTYLVPVAAMMLAAGGCNKCTRLFDSEISAIDRQTQAIEEQNRILERISNALEKGETK